MHESPPIYGSFWLQYGIREPIILASSSPRRAALLQAIGLPFEVVSPQIEEGAYGAWDGGELLTQRAVQKAQEVHSRYPDRAILAADTVVVINHRVLDKPADGIDARRMLLRLSGKRHEVWSALVYLSPHPPDLKTALSQTHVEFRRLHDSEIDAYIITGEPLDKAGAYGIQGLGGLWVRRLSGCYFNVVGLPLSQLLNLLIS